MRWLSADLLEYLLPRHCNLCIIWQKMKATVALIPHAVVLSVKGTALSVDVSHVSSKVPKDTVYIRTDVISTIPQLTPPSGTITLSTPTYTYPHPSPVPPTFTISLPVPPIPTATFTPPATDVHSTSTSKWNALVPHVPSSTKANNVLATTQACYHRLNTKIKVKEWSFKELVCDRDENNTSYELGGWKKSFDLQIYILSGH